MTLSGYINAFKRVARAAMYGEEWAFNNPRYFNVREGVEQ